MTYQRLLVEKSNLSNVELRSEDAPPELGDGEVLVAVERFALSANNISYADAGEMLGYWNFFPESDGLGSIPVWGYARIVRSLNADLSEGELLFGYFPMATHLRMTPGDIDALCFAEASAHRQGQHPWYNRYYRCDADPVFSEANADLQATLWALLMTGWMMAQDLKPQTRTVAITSASSKTALSLAWSLKHLELPVRVVGLTSASNQAFTEARGVYDDVLRYEEAETLGSGFEGVTLVDVAGNPEIASAVHVAVGDGLVDSVTIGATHRTPPGEALPMPGPAPRFFFIPDVAEQAADRDGFDHYHARFAQAWGDFATWAGRWIEFEHGEGAAQIEAAYRAQLSGRLPPERVKLLSWSR